MLRHYIVSALGYLGWLFLGYALFVLVQTVWRGKRPYYEQKLIAWLESIRRKRDKGMAQQTVYAYLLALILLSLLLISAYRQRSNVVTEHNVVIKTQLDNGDWLMSSDEERDLVFRPCIEDEENGVDVNGLLNQAVGFIAEHATWQERGVCKSILREDLGFWFKDEANNFTYRRKN